MSRYWLICGACLVAITVIAIAVRWMRAPDFNVELTVVNNMRRLRITPNSVVNSFLKITIKTEDGATILELAGEPERLVGSQIVILPDSISSGRAVRIQCELQYDRPMPSVRTMEKRLFVK